VRGVAGETGQAGASESGPEPGSGLRMDSKEMRKSTKSKSSPLMNRPGSKHSQESAVKTSGVMDVWG
jgi:hypothetical protein